jgi:hypothetical protein
LKGAGQEGMEKYLGSGQGPNWAVEPLVLVNQIMEDEMGKACSVHGIEMYIRIWYENPKERERP